MAEMCLKQAVQAASFYAMVGCPADAGTMTPARLQIHEDIPHHQR